MIFQMLYTHKRTEMILRAKGIKVIKVERVGITKPSGNLLNCVHVVYSTANGRCSCFLSVKEYLKLAISKRREKANDYKAEQGKNPTQWDVYNPTANVFENPGYKVVATPAQIDCSCRDYQEQPNYLSEHPYLWQNICKGYRVCKHSLAVLTQLGCSTLREYLAGWQAGGKFI